MPTTRQDDKIVAKILDVLNQFLLGGTEATPFSAAVTP